MSGWQRHLCLETGKPWLTEGAISFLEENVKNSDAVLEVGTGASSIFFGRRAKSVFSLEESQEWFCMVSEALTHHKLNNVEVVLLRARLSHMSKQPYLYLLKGLPDESFDWILIDGGDRAVGIEYAIPKLKQEGFLIIDNYSRGEYQRAITEFLSNWERIVFDGPTGFSGGGTAFYRRFHNMIDEREVLQRILKIPGVTLAGELLEIYRLCAELPESCNVVEIGTGLGRATAMLSSIVFSKKGTLYTVDNYSEFEGWKRWVKDSGDKRLNVQVETMEDIRVYLRKSLIDFLPCIQFYECSSDEASKQVKTEIDAIWIDGGHSYEDVSIDLKSWLPKLKVGGIICGHDFNLSGVACAVCEEVLLKFQEGFPVFTNFRTYRAGCPNVSRVWFSKRVLGET